jgi:hypothetical protein
VRQYGKEGRKEGREKERKKERKKERVIILCFSKGPEKG